VSALAIVGVCVGGTCGYCVAASYVYLRLLWYFTERGDSYGDHAIAAFFCAVLLPLGLAVLAIHATGAVDGAGIAPRTVRREQMLKDQQKEIARLERELGIPS
jgi:hypothetical protein